MKSNQDKVREFMEAVDQEIPEQGLMEVPEELFNFRLSLIQDEIEELAETDRDDLNNILRELCDILYVTYGTALAYGFDIQPIFDIVQKANMEKVSGPIREDGKRMKPEGWRFPAWSLAVAVMWQQGIIRYDEEIQPDVED